MLPLLLESSVLPLPDRHNRNGDTFRPDTSFRRGQTALIAVRCRGARISQVQ